MTAPVTRCVNAHDRCYLGGPCPYCEPIQPMRDTQGRFVSGIISFTPAQCADADAIILAVMNALHNEPPEVQAKVRKAIREAQKSYTGGQR